MKIVHFSSFAVTAVLFTGYLPAAVKVSVEPGKVTAEIREHIHGTGMEDVNHEIYGGLDAQRLYGESFEEGKVYPEGGKFLVCPSWFKSESVDGGDFYLDNKVFHQGRASQKLLPRGGTAAIANEGLNRWGVPSQAGRRMRGYLHVRGKVDSLLVGLQDRDGRHTYATAAIPTASTDTWTKVAFTLSPTATDPRGRFFIRASGAGCVWVDDVYLADEPTNVFGHLGCREDIVAAFREEGLDFLRWGGSMANGTEYRLANMRGRGERMPHKGFWSPIASGGFGPYEFVRLAKAMRLPCALSISADETVADAVAFAAWTKEYTTLPVYVQIGNEEGIFKTGDVAAAFFRKYVAKCRALIPPMRAANPALRFVSAAWWLNKELPLMEETFRGTDGLVEYWDIHVGCGTVAEARGACGHIRNVMNLFRKWNPQTTMRIAVFEENANNHSLERALAHAVFLGGVRAMGRDILTSCPANALQPYLQNDNWWDQGQIFFTTDKVWLQPCGYAQKMASAARRPLLVASASDDKDVIVSATRSRTGASVVLHLVNAAAVAKPVQLAVAGAPVTVVRAETLTGSTLFADNPPEAPTRHAPVDITRDFKEIPVLPPYSYTVVELMRQGPFEGERHQMIP